MQPAGDPLDLARILVIDDSATLHREVNEALAELPDVYVIHTHAPGDGIRLALDQRPDLIILDVNMPDMDGFKVCSLLKESVSTGHIPILFITSDTKLRHLERAYECGAADYIQKPVNPVEMRCRVRAALQHKQLVDELVEQARVDSLTGLNNRAALNDALVAAVAMNERNRLPIALLLFDLDHFKDVNDAYGHLVGDEILKGVGHTLSGNCRVYDTPGRFGGDEFGVVMSHCEGAQALAVGKRLLAAVAAVEVESEGRRVRIGTSAGLVTSARFEAPVEASALFKAADDALYAAKARGRGNLVVGDI